MPIANKRKSGDHAGMESSSSKSSKSEDTIWVVLLRNKQTKAVLYTEAGKDFVDLLLSFLTLPMGKVLQLFRDARGSGLKPLGAAIANVYSSFQEFEDTHLYVNKNILLEQKAVCVACSDVPTFCG